MVVQLDMQTKVKLSVGSKARELLSLDKNYSLSPFERSAKACTVHHSDGSRGTVLVSKPEHDSTNMPIIFLPGFISIIDAWEDVLQDLQQDYPLYYYETRDKATFEAVNYSKNHYSAERFALDVVELVSVLELLPAEYILVGSSFACTILTDVLSKHMIEPRSVIFIGASPTFRIPFPGPLLSRIVPVSMMWILRPFIRWYLRTFMVDRKSNERQYQKYIKAVSFANFHAIKYVIANLNGYSQLEKYGDIRAHCIIASAKQDKMHTTSTSEIIVNHIPNAEALVFEDNLDLHGGKLAEFIRIRF